MKNADIRALELIYEANLVDQTSLKIAINDLLIDKNVTDLRVKKWFQKSFIAWYISPADEDQKQGSVEPYQAKEGDPDWMRKPDIMTFVGFTSQQKESLNHIIDFLVNQTEDYKDDLAKGVKTVPQVKQDIINADEASKKQSIPDIFKSKQTVLSQEERDYIILNKYTAKTKTGTQIPVAMVQLTSNYAFREESCNLGHCVGRGSGESKIDRDRLGDPNNPEQSPQSSYYKEFVNGNILILSIKRMDETRQSLVTIELKKSNTRRLISQGSSKTALPARKIIQPGENLFNYEVTQVRGPHNEHPEPILLPVIRDFFENHNIHGPDDLMKRLGFIALDGELHNPSGEEFKTYKKEVLIPKYKRLRLEIEKYTRDISRKEIEKLVEDKVQLYVSSETKDKIKSAIIERIIKTLSKFEDKSLNDSLNKDLVNQYLKILVESYC